MGWGSHGEKYPSCGGWAGLPGVPQGSADPRDRRPPRPLLDIRPAGCLRKATDCGIRSGFTSHMGLFHALVPSEIHHLLAAPPHLIRALSSQGSLTPQPLPSHPLPLAAASFSPSHSHYLSKPPIFCACGCLDPLTSPCDPFPELQPGLLEKASLPMSLSCPQDKIQILTRPSLTPSFLWSP